MPTDDKKTQDSSQNPPVLVSEDTLPPMPPLSGAQTSPSDVPTQSDTSNTSPATNPTSSGSAFPTDDIKNTDADSPVVVTGSTPKKKFAGGRVIATILGLFLLVGGVGAGVYLVQQNQDIREKADAFDECREESGYRVCECRVYGICTRPDYQDDPLSPPNPIVTPQSNTNINNADNSNECQSGGGFWCDQITDSNGQNVGGFCTPQNKTCVRTAIENGLVETITLGCSDGTNGPDVRISCNTCASGYRCPNPGEFGYQAAVIYSCTRAQYEAAGERCDSSTQGYKTLNSIPTCFCGIIQIDASDGSHMSQESTCGCGEGEETPPPGGPSAQCQNVKAYNTTWSPLTSTQLSQLEAGDSVNFCVVGSASSGSFNKARFTINGALQAETTTVRPGSSDFCQSYVIPSGVTTFNVSAQIHHATLGWK